jgi:hypothetical protein
MQRRIVPMKLRGNCAWKRTCRYGKLLDNWYRRLVTSLPGKEQAMMHEMFQRVLDSADTIVKMRETYDLVVLIATSHVVRKGAEKIRRIRRKREGRGGVPPALPCFA